jgi:hypothetical protein
MDIFNKVCNSNVFATPVSQRQLSAANTEDVSCEIGSAKYYALCGFGGLLSCGITHTAVTPLDLVKCRLQVNKEKYKSLGNGFKVRMQTSNVGTFPTTLREAAPQIYKAEGINGFYKSLVPLWGRQIPYTMMKFACFERTVEAIYQFVVPKPRAECSKGEQLIVTFAAGYIAGVFCAIVSHPADTVVSYMNKAKGSTIGSAAKALGFKGMWGGLGPRIIMIGTLTALQWFIYDSVKVVFKLPRPPPAQMPDSLRKKLEAQQQ